MGSAAEMLLLTVLMGWLAAGAQCSLMSRIGLRLSSEAAHKATHQEKARVPWVVRQNREDKENLTRHNMIFKEGEDEVEGVELEEPCEGGSCQTAASDPSLEEKISNLKHIYY